MTISTTTSSAVGRQFGLNGNVLPEGDNRFYGYDPLTGAIAVSFSSEFDDVDVHEITLGDTGGTVRFWIGYSGNLIADEEWCDENFPIDYFAIFDVTSFERIQGPRPVPIPVPASLPLLAAGLGAVAALGRRRLAAGGSRR